MNARCEATNEVGVRCLWLDHKGDFHMYADDRDRYAHHYGRLSAAVSAFLSHQPGADRDFLSRALAEAESTLTEAEPERIGANRSRPMTPEEIVDLVMPPAEPVEVVVEVYGGVARVAQDAPGVVVRIVDYTAEGELVAHACELGR